ncbi:AraC family transcriptional regulator ligand-binding domain-containing protein [Catenovulum sp. SM1970]|uniref:AraC family transcriptional regulator ligand-binding domain-containing protein n=1 Tax=Marinifaba aquimaris TaxID=2741323 RepID=UPI001573AC52|nr:AraC family transcriptional regulator ligand-binding domain-containing protein [Marinifaba aquimaris]NTS77627.1 AraC family transcriptional regulator ligand-binding domain-containing protein [Marinifaba aquimaris]
MMQAWLEQHEKIIDSHQIALGLIELAKQRGADEDALLKGTGLFADDLQRAQYQCSTEQLAKLLTNLKKQPNYQDISFMMGHRLLVGKFSAIANVLSHAKDLNDALRLICLYQRQLFPYAFFVVKRHNNTTYLLFENSITEQTDFQFWLELICAAIHANCKWLLKQSVPIRYYFKAARPKNIYQYEHNLGHKLNFSQPLDMLAIEDSYLSIALPHASQSIRKQMRFQCKSAQTDYYHFQLLAGRSRKQVQRGLIQFVYLHLQKGRATNLEQMADLMSISTATLKRKLKLHGIKFQTIQDNVKKQQAIFDLTVRGKANVEVASYLNFTDLTNFRRAFKRWTGKNPSQVNLG